MRALRNIFSIATYERIMLTRSIRFRFLGFVGIAIPMFFGVVLAIAETFGEIDERASVFGFSAFVPFYFFTYTQTALTAFIAGNFRAADDHAEVGEVIAARPMSNTEIVLGKYFGTLQALAGLATFVALLTISIQAAKLSIMGAPFSLAPYLYYFFVMMLPALIFMSALTFCLGSLLRNPTLVTVLSVAYGLSVLFYLGHRYDGWFDFGAFFAPLFYSDMLGVGDISRLLQLRVMYLAISLALLGIAVAAYPRLSAPGWAGKTGHAMAALGIGAAAMVFTSVSAQDAAIVDQRSALLATQVAYVDVPAPTVRHYDAELTLMGEEAPLSATVGVRVANPHSAPLDSLVFTLNPGLVISAVTDDNGAALDVSVEGSVIRVALMNPLPPGEETEIHLRYTGDIDTEGFDLRRGTARLEKWDGPIHKGDLTAWILEGSAYLPPRSRWYPAAGVDYGHTGSRPASFFTARIDVDVPAGLSVVTQGEPSTTPESGPATSRHREVWEVLHPVPVLSLNVDTYDVVSAEIAGVDVALYLAPQHRPLVDFFEDATDEVKGFVAQLMSAMESESGLPYPYPRLSVVEIPFLVQWYYEGWEESGGLTQPGVLMIEEDAFIERLSRIKQSFDRARRAKRNAGSDPARLKRDQLANAVFTAFLSSDFGRNNSGGLYRSPLVQLWSFNREFTGDNANLMARGLPVYMQEDVSGRMRELMFDQRPQRRGAVELTSGEISRQRSIGSGSLVGWDAQLAAMQQDPLSDFDVDANPDLYRAVLDTKGLTMFRVIEAVVGSGAFTNAVSQFGDNTAYGDVSFEGFEEAVVPQDGTDSSADLTSLIKEWVHGTQVPGYTVTYADTIKRGTEWGAVEYQVVVRVRNGEPGRGFAQVQVISDGDTLTRNVQVDGGEEIEVSMVVAGRPRRVSVEPFLAKNRRPISVPLRVPEEVTEGPAASYVRQVRGEEIKRGEVIVDNEDEGFSMPLRRVQRYLRPGLAGADWRVRYATYSYGLYETNFRWRPPGDGSQPALWTTTLPYEGEYEVAYYHLPERLNGHRIRWQAAEHFSLKVTHADGVTEVPLDYDRLEPGWNPVGRFRFTDIDDAVVELSDEADGYTYADAMRWRYLDPKTAGAEYFDPVAPWEAARNYPGGSR